MPLYIRDETANALVLTIDNNGNMAFADGNPIDRLTLG
jgi:prepilin-type processing-associated H-X9-DG protein